MNLVALYETLTLSLGRTTGSSDGLLHVHAGMALLLLARLITGRSLGTAIPFLVVCVFALGNEGLDRINHGVWDWPDAMSDVAATCFWPFVLTASVRFKRALRAKQATGDPVCNLT